MGIATDTPDFEDKKSWQLVLQAAIHYNDSKDVKAKSLMEMLLAGGDLKLPGEGDAKTKIGIVLKYKSLKDPNITGKTISFFDDSPVFKIWGNNDKSRQLVAIRFHKSWVLHDLGGEILKTIYIKDSVDKSATHIYFEFYNTDKRCYAYIFLENPKHPLVETK